MDVLGVRVHSLVVHLQLHIVNVISNLINIIKINSSWESFTVVFFYDNI